MRHILSRRASAKQRNSGRRVTGDINMAATGKMAEGSGGGVAAVVSAVGGGSGGVSGGVNSGGGGGGVSVPPPTSPVPEWTGDAVALKDLASKRKVPGFARVVKGSYMTIGASKFSLQKQHHDVYVHSVKLGVKVLAHCLRRVEVAAPRRGQTYSRLASTDQRLAVPISYQGWFELLSEDGKSARPIASVPELAKAFPARCLVRENIKGYLSPGGEGRLTFDKTKIIPAGEQLKLCGELSLPAPSEGVKVKLLRCLDSKGDSVYLSFDQKGLFTPIAGESDFVGVFNIRDIVRRFRLPLTVKLAHGVRPRVPDSKFSGMIRLDWVYTEETAFVVPVEKNHVRLLPVPCDTPLQLVAASNPEEMATSELFRSMQTKCARMVSNYNNTLHLIVTVPEAIIKTSARNTRASNIFSTPAVADADKPSPKGGSKVRRSKSREDLLMADIDELYGYVRDGGEPPKLKVQYDSDEESYWEEPAYEPLDDFRARLKALESGRQVSFHSKYRPADPEKLKGLVGGSGRLSVPPRQPPPLPSSSSGDGVELGESAEGVGEDLYGVMSSSSSNGLGQDTSAAAAVTPGGVEEPPPLPPRPPEMLSAAAVAAASNSSSNVAMALRTTSPQQHPVLEASRNSFSSNVAVRAYPRRESAPLLPSPQNHLSIGVPSQHQQQNPPSSSTSSHRLSSATITSSSLSPTANNYSKDSPGVTTATTDSRRAGGHSHSHSQSDARPRAVSRSDSEPSITNNANRSPTSPSSPPTAAAVARVSQRQGSQQQQGGGGGVGGGGGGGGSSSSKDQQAGAGGQVKLDWKERLRQFNAMEEKDKDKEGSSSSSGSTGEQQRVLAQRMARDFKDSDISSRTKASSSSSGGKGVRKRMQTLYL